MPFIKLYRVISILGVGAFGVVLEVENQVTKETSALKVGFYFSFRFYRSLARRISNSSNYSTRSWIY